MDTRRIILSEEEDALDGAIEWLDEAIAREEENDRLSRQVEDHIRPLVLKVAEEMGYDSAPEK